MHRIDPDRQGVGDDPIYVYCDMTLGSTSILHDSESTIHVDHCTDPGCYSRKINYNATSGQIAMLADLSFECHQSIKYDCTNAPLEINGVAYSWWNDRTDNPQYFWSGNNVSVHTCQCGIDNNCAETLVTCNCDSNLAEPLVDNGLITDKNILPITRLNFGHTSTEGSSGQHTLGRLECSGQAPVNRMAASCADLKLIGHTLSGMHSILGVQQIETVYCDFTKLPNEPGFQTWIGYADVKSLPVSFYVQKNIPFNTMFVPIPFEEERLNVGKAMNSPSGIFTAPRKGKYFFSLTGIAKFPISATTQILGIGFFWNGSKTGMGWANEISNVLNVDQHETFSLQSTLEMQVGDQVSVQITQMSSGSHLYDNGAHFTHFTGWLLEEDISQSLHMVSETK